jgi:hypothetical protein
VGEMSDVVDTDSGVHIILRTGWSPLPIHIKPETLSGDIFLYLHCNRVLTAKLLWDWLRAWTRTLWCLVVLFLSRVSEMDTCFLLKKV